MTSLLNTNVTENYAEKMQTSSSALIFFPALDPESGTMVLCFEEVPGVTGQPAALTAAELPCYPGISGDEAERVFKALRSRLLTRLGLVRRSGGLVQGYVKVKESLRSGHCLLVLQAQDGSPREQSRLLTGSTNVRTEKVFSADELGAVCGRDKAHHAALKKTAFAADWVRNLDAYLAFING